MTPEAQNVSIAKWCGMVYHKPTEEEVASGSYYQYEPDYRRDLNLIRKPVSDLIRLSNLGSIYILHLWEITGAQKRVGFMHELHPNILFEQVFIISLAAPEQQAEALLKTLNLWDE